jgi:hypothetical protein
MEDIQKIKEFFSKPLEEDFGQALFNRLNPKDEDLEAIVNILIQDPKIRKSPDQASFKESLENYIRFNCDRNSIGQAAVRALNYRNTGGRYGSGFDKIFNMLVDKNNLSKSLEESLTGGYPYKKTSGGDFERIDIVRTNDTLIRLINNEYSFLNPPTLVEIQNNKIIHKGCTDLSQELNSYIGWFIKDSRLCFTLGLYNLSNLSVIKVVRNPQSVRQSMIRHYGNLFEYDIIQGPHTVKKIDFDYYYDNINKCIDWQMSHLPNITVNYEDLIDGKIENLESFLESKVNKSIINPKYRNYDM